MARTRVKLRRPYRLQTTLDLGELVLVARYDASREKACTASLPQAPYDSATRGIHVHPNSEHLASLAECFLSYRSLKYPPHCFLRTENRSWSCKVLNFLISHTFKRKHYISIARILDVCARSLFAETILHHNRANFFLNRSGLL